MRCNKVCTHEVNERTRRAEKSAYRPYRRVTHEHTGVFNVVPRARAAAKTRARCAVCALFSAALGASAMVRKFEIN